MPGKKKLNAMAVKKPLIPTTNCQAERDGCPRLLKIASGSSQSKIGNPSKAPPKAAKTR
jgi:hypothetical protein